MSSSPSRQMKIGDLLFRRLEEVGVRHVFSVPGDGACSLIHQIVALCFDLIIDLSRVRRNRQGYKASVSAIPFAQAPPLSNANSQVMTPPNSFD